MSGHGDWMRLQGALALGLDRQPLPTLDGFRLDGLDTPARALAMVALLGQHLRLASPIAPTVETRAEGLPDDPHPMLPPAARDTLRRLDRRLDADSRRRLAPLLIAAISGVGRRVHIFDLPVLEPLLRAAPERLGVAERA